jgi:hypothetical protein
LSAQAFTKTIDDDKRSAVSGQSAKALSPALFFDSVITKSAVEIGEAEGTGDFYLRTVISDCLLIGVIRATETLRKN